MNQAHRSKPCLLAAAFLSFFLIHPRSAYRPLEDNFPEVAISWDAPIKQKLYTIRNSHLEEFPLFLFKTSDFDQHQIHNKQISYTNNNTIKKVNGTVLDKLIQHLIGEIKARKKKFTHFTVLLRRNFNTRRKCGLIVLKFNDYPFVLKLFIERPETFVSYHAKGIEPSAFFYMAGGSNRHIAGLTRIKNRNIVAQKLAALPQWEPYVTMPRKWFWTPKKSTNLCITGKNLGGKKSLHTVIPSTYAIIADAIDTTQSVDLPINDQKKIVMQLCNDLDMFIDPHYNNFIFSRHKGSTKHSITIIDTEHFPSIVGIKDKKEFTNHTSWVAFLAGKCFGDVYLRTKHDRTTAQTRPHYLALR